MNSRRNKASHEASIISLAERRAKQRAVVAGWRDRIQSPLPADVTVAGAYEVYLEDLVRRGRATVDQESAYRNYLGDAFGSTRVRDLTTAEVVAWVEALTAAGLAPKTVRKVHAFLGAAIELVRVRCKLERNPARPLPSGKLPPNETRPGFNPALEIPLPEEVIRLVSHPEIPLVRRLCYALLATVGGRLNEILSLVWDDLEEMHPLWRITISRAWSRKGKRMADTKTGRHKVAAVHPEILRPLLEEMRDREFPRVFGRAARGSDLIVAYRGICRGAYRDADGEPRRYPETSALRHLREDLVLCAIDPRKRLHSFRHFFVSTLIDRGADERTVLAITHPRTAKKDAPGQYIWITWAARQRAIKRFGGRLLAPRVALAEVERARRDATQSSSRPRADRVRRSRSPARVVRTGSTLRDVRSDEGGDAT